MSGHRVLFDMRKAPFMVVDPGNAGTIKIDRWGQVVPVVTAAAETRTLAQPTKAGLQATILLDTDGGDLTLTVTGGYNQAAATSITFGDAGDWVMFLSVKVGTSYYWRVVQYEGTGLTMAERTITALEATAATIATLTATALKLAVTSVNAAGSNISSATALSAGLNIVGTADNTKGVQLPVASAGLLAVVRSTVASKSLPVYPQVSSDIDALGANNAITLAAAGTGAACIFVASNTTRWNSLRMEDDT